MFHRLSLRGFPSCSPLWSSGVVPRDEAGPDAEPGFLLTQAFFLLLLFENRFGPTKI